MRMLSLIALLVGAVAAIAQTANRDIPQASVKGVARRELSTPGLVLETGARTAALDVAGRGASSTSNAWPSPRPNRSTPSGR